MNLNRLWVLIRKEIRSGSSGFMLIFAVVVPLVLSLIVTLLFGSIFTEDIRVGMVDLGESQVTTKVSELAFVNMSTYETETALRDALEVGNVDMGLVVPSGFDAAVQAGDAVELPLLVWGQSLAQNRVLFGASVGRIVNEIAGREIPLTINTVNLGDGVALPIEERLVPFLVLMAVVIGGTMVPASSLVEEKQKRTLTAVTTTPTHLTEVLLSKAVVGAVLSVFVAVLTLVLNRAFGGEPVLLILTLALSATLSASFGILLGSLVKDTNTLFATIKGIGILLYAPALIYLFPDIPQAIAKVFPTYYIVAPVISLTQEGGGFADIAPHLAMLVVLNLAMIAVVAFVIREPARREALSLA